MRADSHTHDAIVELITETYRRMSTPGSEPAALMSHPDFAVAGSGLGELAYDHETVKGMADVVFAREEDETWAWRYWGGAEPQEEPRV